MPRSFGRGPDQMRPTAIEPHAVKFPAGSAMISCGDTRVLCTVMVEESVPPFLRGRPQPQGWLTAEYALLPGSGLTRNPRPGYSGSAQVKGRVHEIQRLIGRSLRAVLDLSRVGERTLAIDCDVIQADGGTRTAAVNGAMVALRLAMAKLLKEGKITQNPICGEVAAISVGIVRGEVLLDLDYAEDSDCDTDMNVVMNDGGGFIELQGTAEGHAFRRDELDALLGLAEQGIGDLFAAQRAALAG